MNGKGKKVGMLGAAAEEEEDGGGVYRTRVLTLMAGMLYRALTAALIWCLEARTSQMNTRVCSARG